MAGLRLAAPPRRTRRRRPAQARELDLRRTVRRALRTGGDPARLARRERRLRPRRLVLILDVSGSMSEYSRAARLRACSAACRPSLGGVLLRHAPDARHAGARRLEPRRGARACDVGRRRLGRRHPHRRRSQGLPRPLRARRPRPGRRRRPLLGRPRHRRSGPPRRADGAAPPPRPRGGVAEPAAGAPPTSRSPGAWRLLSLRRRVHERAQPRQPRGARGRARPVVEAPLEPAQEGRSRLVGCPVALRGESARCAEARGLVRAHGGTPAPEARPGLAAVDGALPAPVEGVRLDVLPAHPEDRGGAVDFAVSPQLHGTVLEAAGEVEVAPLAVDPGLLPALSGPVVDRETEALQVQRGGRRSSPPERSHLDLRRRSSSRCSSRRRGPTCSPTRRARSRTGVRRRARPCAARRGRRSCQVVRTPCKGVRRLMEAQHGRSRSYFGSPTDESPRLAESKGRRINPRPGRERMPAPHSSSARRAGSTSTARTPTRRRSSTDSCSADGRGIRARVRRLLHVPQGRNHVGSCMANDGTQGYPDAGPST